MESEKPLFLQDEKSKDVSILFFNISSAGEGDLEDILPEKPEGLKLVEDFISKEEEEEVEKEVMKKMDSSGIGRLRKCSHQENPVLDYVGITSRLSSSPIFLYKPFQCTLKPQFF